MRYIFQRINDRIFTNPVALMENIQRVTEEAHRQLEIAGVPDASRRSLTALSAKDGFPYHRDQDGKYRRGYLFIEGAKTYE